MSGQLSMETWLLPKGAASVDPSKPLGKMQRFAPEEKRCTNKDGHKNRCKWWFLASDPHQECPKCRRATKRSNDSEAGKRSKATYRDANREEVNEKNAERKEERRADPEKRAHDQQVSAEYRRSAAGLESNARYRAKHCAELRRKGREAAATPMGLLSASLRKMVKGEHWDPVSFAALGSFQTNEEAMMHFEARFEPWMSWENRGRHVKGNAYNEAWNIGHALPRKIFDQSDEADLRRCWHPDNLFPQCARQNTELRDALIYTDDELLEMRHLWPAGANDDLEELKGLFQFVDHDFIRSKLPVGAGPSGLNDGFVSDDASSTSG
jgi:hypothetical protein